MKRLRHSSSRLLQIDDQKLDAALQQVAKRSEEVANYFDVEIGSADQLSAILDQAKETLLILALAANRQASDAKEAIGTLEAGKFADLVVVDRDLLTCPEDQIASTQVLRTYFNGKLIAVRE